MVYKYRNLKNVILHGIPPRGIGEFNHPIEGGGIELIEQSEEKEEKRKFKKIKKQIEEVE